MRFKYKGVNKSRENVSGTVEAGDVNEARLRLRSLQVRATSLVAVKEASRGLFGRGSASSGERNSRDNNKKKPLFQFSKPLTLKELVVFTRQFSSLIDSGVPVVQCLDILYGQERKKPFKKILGEIKEDIEGGAGLADAFSRHPTAFSEYFIRILEAGEVSGTLDKAIRRIGIQLERLGKIKSKVIGAMIYPCITVVVAIGALIFLLVKVIPEVAKLYTEGNAKLPELTVQVLALSDFMQNNIVLILAIFIGGGMSIPVIYKLEGFRKIFDPLVLKMPAFGPLVKKSAIARFSRTLSSLIASGVPLINSFEICIKLMDNLAVKAVLQRAIQSVTEGKSIAQGLQQNEVFPPMVIHMVNIGEMTGRLDELLGKVADIYDDELDDAVGLVTGLIQPVLIVGVGGIVAFLLMAMYLPIFQLAEKVVG